MSRHFVREHQYRQIRARRAARRAGTLSARLAAWWRSPDGGVLYGVPGGPMTAQELRALLAPEPTTAVPAAAPRPRPAASGRPVGGTLGRR